MLSANLATMRCLSSGMILVCPCWKSVARQHAALRAEAVRGVRHRQLDLLDAHFQRVARLGAFDEDWAGEYMAAGTLLVAFTCA